MPRERAKRTIIVGDVHGCLDELQRLLRAVGADCAGGDDVILVGDLVAKGPESQGVVQLCRETGVRAVVGNHDEKVLSLQVGAQAAKKTAAGVATGGSSPGVHQDVAASLGQEDWRYLRSLPAFLRVPHLNAVVVHGGLIPGLPLDEQPRKFLLNLRSITDDGQPSTRVSDGVPWGTRWPGPEHVVFGHDAVRGLQQHPSATGLDTGCVYGNRLTALVLPERKFVSVPAARAYASL